MPPVTCDMVLRRNSYLCYQTGNTAALMLPGNKRETHVSVWTGFVTYKIIWRQEIR
jgi:hypothetical protein